MLVILGVRSELSSTLSVFHKQKTRLKIYDGHKHKLNCPDFQRFRKKVFIILTPGTCNIKLFMAVVATVL
jgi:hypothetical protein